METNPSSEFVVQFWGVRGSIPAPGKDTVRYGGNTSCVEMRVGGKRLIFDGGTGLRLLGKSLLSEPPGKAYMFFTHYHWDHIQGVPFFTPLFREGYHFHIYGGMTNQEGSTKKYFGDRILHPNNPIPLEEMPSDLKFDDLFSGDVVKIDDITIETGTLNHPNGAIGYRVTWQGFSAVYCTDTEHFPDRLDENVLELSRDADLLIYDAMYTDPQYNDPKSPKVGWGHSTWEAGVEVAKAAGVKRIAMFHHEPNHNDDRLDEIAVDVQEAFSGGFLAREGMIVPVA